VCEGIGRVALTLPHEPVPPRRQPGHRRGLQRERSPVPYC
jgi:hypothetical protein